MNPLLMIAVAILWLPLSACAFVYHAEAIEGWVVEAETGKPIEGVIVVAHWQLKGGFEGGNPIAQLQIYESVTDQNGRYFFPAWGPKFALSGHLKSESPRILFFKSGYKYLGVDNDWYRGMDTSKSDWNKKTVKLERFKGTFEEYALDLRGLSSTLESVGYGVSHDGGDPCGWKMFPRILRALDRLETEFRSAGLVQGTVVSFFKSNDKLLQDKGCGSVFELLGGGK